MVLALRVEGLDDHTSIKSTDSFIFVQYWDSDAAGFSFLF